ncbi:MAG: hypothetical protein V4697_04205, partial [Patescibacteria group bacterium]
MKTFLRIAYAALIIVLLVSCQTANQTAIPMGPCGPNCAPTRAQLLAHQSIQQSQSFSLPINITFIG